MTKIPVTFISSVTKVKANFILPEPMDASETPQARSRWRTKVMTF